MEAEAGREKPGNKPGSLFDSASSSLQFTEPADVIPNTATIDDRNLNDNTMAGSSSDPESGLPAREKSSPAQPQQNHAQHTPPNGGLTAWIQVAAGFAIFFNTWGVLNTFGVFQTYYETGELFVESSSNIAWIGAMQSYCVLLGGLISGPIYDRGYFRHLLLSGSFLIVLGFMMLSICHTFWQALLAQGFCSGIGAGLLFVPSMAVLPAYFSTKLGLAMGLAASGSSLGGVIYPIMFYRLINTVGFGWAVRGLGFVALVTLLVPIFFMKMGNKPAKPRAILDWTAFTDWPFLIFTISTTVGFVGLYVMLFYISYFAFETHAASAEMAFYLVPILNVGSMFGRTLPNALSDKTGPINLLVPGALICGGLTYAMIGVESLAGIIIITLLYGFFSGVFIALPPVCFVRLTNDKSKIGTRLGMGFAFLGCGVLAGGPGGGSVLGVDPANLHWTSLWVFGGTFAVGSGLLLGGLRFWLSKGKLMMKI